MKVEKLTVADLEVKQLYEKQDKDNSDTYGSVSAGREKRPFNVLFFF